MINRQWEIKVQSSRARRSQVHLYWIVFSRQVYQAAESTRSGRLSTNQPSNFTDTHLGISHQSIHSRTLQNRSPNPNSFSHPYPAPWLAWRHHHEHEYHRPSHWKKHSRHHRHEPHIPVVPVRAPPAVDKKSRWADHGEYPETREPEGEKSCLVGPLIVGNDVRWCIHHCIHVEPAETHFVIGLGEVGDRFELWLEVRKTWVVSVKLRVQRRYRVVKNVGWPATRLFDFSGGENERSRQIQQLGWSWGYVLNSGETWRSHPNLRPILDANAHDTRDRSSLAKICPSWNDLMCSDAVRPKLLEKCSCTPDEARLSMELRRQVRGSDVG